MSLANNLSGTPEEIVEYLRNHPDFFVLHPELIPVLVIPHITQGNVASLIEYQVARLRQQLADLQYTVNEIETGSTGDRKFASGIHALSLDLFACTSPGQLYHCLQKGLKTHYSADRMLLLLFSKTAAPANFPGMHFMDSNSKLRFMFTEIFHRNKPLCGSLQEEHLIELFELDIDSIKSTVLLPMDHPCWQGLLVLGSCEANRYGLGFALDLLVYLKDIVYLKINSFTAERKYPHR
jgi:uncharacterized protein YigA (DUF484 family)